MPRFDYQVPPGFANVDEVAREFKKSFSAKEINFLNTNAARYGYKRVGNSWIYSGGH